MTYTLRGAGIDRTFADLSALQAFVRDYREPVDCVLGEWHLGSVGPWSACQPDGTQSRTETWVRDVLVAPAYGGADCGPAQELRIGTQACVYVPPLPPDAGQHAVFEKWSTGPDVIRAASLRDSQETLDVLCGIRPTTTPEDRDWSVDTQMEAARVKYDNFYPQASASAKPNPVFSLTVKSGEQVKTSTGSVLLYHEYFLPDTWANEPIWFLDAKGQKRRSVGGPTGKNFQLLLGSVGNQRRYELRFGWLRDGMPDTPVGAIGSTGSKAALIVYGQGVPTELANGDPSPLTNLGPGAYLNQNADKELGSNAVAPQLAPMRVPYNTWTRFAHLVERATEYAGRGVDPVDGLEKDFHWDRYSLWMHDATRGLVQIFHRLPILKLTDNCGFWFELNNSGFRPRAVVWDATLGKVDDHGVPTGEYRMPLDGEAPTLELGVKFTYHRNFFMRMNGVRDIPALLADMAAA